MSELAGFAYTPQNVRELDRIAIDEVGIPGFELMSRAGRAAFEATVESFPDARRWLVLCGAGNNAGDGYVIARLARQAALEVTVSGLGDPIRLSGDAGRAYGEFLQTGGAAVPFDAGLLGDADLIVDAMLGTGLDRPLKGAYLDAVEAVSQAPAPVVAVDIPSGLNGLNGEVMGAAVRAQLTVTFVGLKQGFFVGQGPEYVGKLVFDDLDVPFDAVHAVPRSLRVYRRQNLNRLLPVRERTAHKGDFGHVLVVGGNIGMAGAARMAGEAALRAGAGLVTVATRPENLAAINGQRPELMCCGVEKPRDLSEVLKRATVIALGPGLGHDMWAASLVRRLLRAPQPKVVDADALNHIARKKPKRRDDWILTPHPGEAARLLRTDTAAIQTDRIAAVAELARLYGGAAVLKGRNTLIAGPDTGTTVIPAGNPGMASAGMGDVLTGIIAGVLAQTSGQNLVGSAAAGAYVHACAGDAAAETGERGIIATDLLMHLKPCLNDSG